jgi:hypothetical protein
LYASVKVIAPAGMVRASTMPPIKSNLKYLITFDLLLVAAPAYAGKPLFGHRTDDRAGES